MLLSQKLFKDKFKYFNETLISMRSLKSRPLSQVTNPIPSALEGIISHSDLNQLMAKIECCLDKVAIGNY